MFGFTFTASLDHLEVPSSCVISRTDVQLISTSFRQLDTQRLNFRKFDSAAKQLLIEFQKVLLGVAVLFSKCQGGIYKATSEPRCKNWHSTGFRRCFVVDSLIRPGQFLLQPSCSFLLSQRLKENLDDLGSHCNSNLRPESVRKTRKQKTAETAESVHGTQPVLFWGCPNRFERQEKRLC